MNNPDYNSALYERLYKEHEVISKKRESMYRPNLKEEVEINEKCTFHPVVCGGASKL